MDNSEKKETIVKLFAKAMFYGDWVWETPNERVIEMLMREIGMCEFENEDDMIEKTQVDEFLYKEAIKKVPIRETSNEYADTECGAIKTQKDE